MRSIGVNLHFDKEGNVIIVPVLQHPIGYGVMSYKFTKLQSGYTKKQLSQAVLQAIDVSIINELEDEQRNFWTEATGIKGFAAFSKRYKCISINYVLEKDGYSVVAEKRYKDGSYGCDKDDIPFRVKEYPGKPSVDTIADQVLEALKIGD